MAAKYLQRGKLIVLLSPEMPRRPYELGTLKVYVRNHSPLKPWM